MSIAETVYRPVRGRRDAKHDVRTQFGAVPWRLEGGRLELLLVTGRKSGKWSVPKGWPAGGEMPADAAAREAWEEAGATGLITPSCLGIYTCARKSVRRMRFPCVVALFPLEVLRLEAVWPEQGQRQRRWATTEEAATLAANPELASVLLGFDPRTPT
jgi:8-oxo-dGTP pyrophosphatase MutT (NUDIX family)